MSLPFSRRALLSRASTCFGMATMLVLASCTVPIHWKEPYKSYTGVDLVTKDNLWMYGVDPQLTGLSNLHPLILGNRFPDESSVEIPLGTKVRFERAYRQTGIGGESRWMQGQLEYLGSWDRVGFKFEMFGYPDDQMLERCFRASDERKSKKKKP